MDKGANRPVKAACLACRASKTRCDGQHPCKPCLNKDRSCVYQPNRRGGPRRSAKKAKETQRLVKPRSEPSWPQSQPETVIDTSQSTVPSVIEDEAPPAVDPSLWDIQALLFPFRRAPNSSQASDLWDLSNAESYQGEIRGPVLRVYTSEEQIINAYYHFLHPFLPLLPPAVSLNLDNPEVFQPSPEEASTVNRSSLPYQPTSSLGLALSAILALIPPPQDKDPSEPCNVWLRRSYAQLFAQAALHGTEKEIEESAVNHHSSSYPVEGQQLHPDLSPRLHPILALVLLSVYEFCQCGSISRMRMRANQAVTAAMDYSLHQLDETASEALRRAWWAAVLVMYHSSTVNMSPPIISIDDPRITTPYPVFDIQSKAQRPWLLILRAEHAFTSVSAIVNPTGLKGRNLTPGQDPRDQIHQLDAHLLSITKEYECDSGPTGNVGSEGLAARSLGLIACVLVHSARIKLHRSRAFSDIPIFLEKHCDLDSIEANNLTPQESFPQIASGLKAIFPFTQEESSLVCLKSSLAVSRALKDLSTPAAASAHIGLDQPDPANLTDTTFHAAYSNPVRPGTLPYFKCAGMQACYTLYMLANRVRVALTSKRLSTCYSLMSHPEPTTEVQDAMRLLEELQNGVHCVISSMKLDTIFESIASMIRDLDAVYTVTFPS